VHRFTKSQQDALLPGVEDGSVIFIGATTENPYFEVNPPLLSRGLLYRLEPLAEDDLRTLLARAVTDPRGLPGLRVEREAIEALVAAADAAGTSVVFTGTWGVRNGGLRLLARHRPDEVAIGGHGYGDGAVELTGFGGAHPLFAGLPAPLRPLAEDGYYSFLDRYVGPYLADVAVAERGGEVGVGVAYDFRSAGSVHLLLSVGAVSDLIGPGYGWTEAGEKLFLNAIAWAVDVEQVAPAAPTLATAAEPVVAASPITLTGTAEFRSTVTIVRDGTAVGEVAPERDGTFALDVALAEGPNVLTAVATNFAGESPASAAVTVTLDTTAPAVTWTPADGSGFFASALTVSGTATDAHAGLAEVLVNGAPASLTPDGNFAAEVTLVPGANDLVLAARDRVGNETTETRRVAYFPYTARWKAAGDAGRGTLNAFLDITDATGAPIQVDSARAELVREDGGVQTAADMTYEKGRYHASFGKPPPGTYRLRGHLVVEGWNVRLTGPVVTRARDPVPSG
jgi:hypothetical protein